MKFDLCINHHVELLSQFTYSAFQESVMIYNNIAIVIDQWTYLASVYQLYDFVSSFWFPEFTNQKISLLKFTSKENSEWVS